MLRSKLLFSWSVLGSCVCMCVPVYVCSPVYKNKPFVSAFHFRVTHLHLSTCVYRNTLTQKDEHSKKGSEECVASQSWWLCFALCLYFAWQIPWTEEPGGLQSMGSLRVGQDWATSLSLFTFVHWRRKWQPTPVFMPGESQGWGSLVGCHLWGRTESDTTEAT